MRLLDTWCLGASRYRQLIRRNGSQPRSTKNPLMYDMNADGAAELHGRDDTCRSAPRRH